jgi:hypothetical protein
LKDLVVGIEQTYTHDVCVMTFGESDLKYWVSRFKYGITSALGILIKIAKVKKILLKNIRLTFWKLKFWWFQYKLTSFSFFN